MKTYIISVSLDSYPAAHSEQEAIKKANEAIKQGFYSLEIIEEE
jgi:hypothetical protein